MRIALAQLNPTIGALEENLKRIKNYYRQAESEGAEVVVFTELSLSGYPPLDLLLDNHFLDRERELITAELAPLTAEPGNPSIVIGAAHREGSKLYNGALVLEGGGIKATHLKSLLPNFDVFDEERYFTRCTDRRVEMLGDLPTAITVCEDIWNDGDYFTAPLYDFDPLIPLFAGGARLLLNLSASPYHLGKHSLREEMLAFLARKYEAGIIYLNQVGGNDELIFDGSSLVYNKRGELIYRAAGFAEELFFVDTADLFQAAAEVVPPDRDDIETIRQVLNLGMRDYVRKTGFRKVALGLSGGIDSAVVATLAAQALGAENVLGLLMPSPYSSTHSIEDAALLAKNLGIEQRQVDISKPYHAFIDLLNNGGDPVMDLAEENLQARIRGTVLMHYANREGYLALATGNKSEVAVGYCTLYGDMVGGLAVIADLLKMQVYELAEHLNHRANRAIIPERSITKAPSAELKPDQKDEDSLPPYEILDPILQLYIEENRSSAEIIAGGFDAETVTKVVGMVDRAEFKRRQAAPGLRVTSKAFGPGRRMPMARGYR